MNTQQHLVSLDIGTANIYIALGQVVSPGQIRIVSIAEGPSAGIKRGSVFNAEEASQAIRAVWQKIPELSEFGLNRVYAGISGLHIRDQLSNGSRIITSPNFEITQKDVDDLLTDMHQISVEAGEEIIHVLPQSFMVDNETGISNPVGVTGRRLEGNFHIIVGQAGMIRNLERAIQKAGLMLAGIQYNILAAAEAILSEDEKEAGVLVAEIGAGTTNIAIYRDFSLISTSIIPFAGNVITSDIREGCNILPKQAEQLKVQFGLAVGDMADEKTLIGITGIKDRGNKQIPIKTLAFIIQARMEEIIEAIQFEMEKAGVKNKLGGGIVITGGSAHLKHIGDLFSLKTGQETRPGRPDEWISPDTPVEFRNPYYSTVIGLLIRGLKQFVPVGPIPVEDTEDQDDDPSGGFFNTFFGKLMGEPPKKKRE
jgi:cell division protein FtsA